MAAKLFASADRNESHRFLEQARLTHPRAECREDSNAGEYSVWDGPEEKIAAPPTPPPPPPPSEDELLERLAAKLMQRMILTQGSS